MSITSTLNKCNATDSEHQYRINKINDNRQRQHPTLVHFRLPLSFRMLSAGGALDDATAAAVVSTFMKQKGTSF